MNKERGVRHFRVVRLGTMLLVGMLGSAGARGQSAEDRWERQIAAFEQQDRQQPVADDGIVFVGSSSVRLWDLAASFPDWPVVNRGFGGSQMSDVVRYADRIVLPYRPRLIVVYAGDNDLAEGKTPRRVRDDFRELVEKVHQADPETHILFLAIKPSLARWNLIEQVREANRMMAQEAARHPRLGFVDVASPMIGDDGRPRAELFVEDGLHLSAAGYRLWTRLVREAMEEVRSAKCSVQSGHR